MLKIKTYQYQHPLHYVTSFLAVLLRIFFLSWHGREEKAFGDILPPLPEALYKLELEKVLLQFCTCLWSWPWSRNAPSATIRFLRCSVIDGLTVTYLGVLMIDDHQYVQGGSKGFSATGDCFRNLHGFERHDKLVLVRWWSLCPRGRWRLRSSRSYRTFFPSSFGLCWLETQYLLNSVKRFWSLLSKKLSLQRWNSLQSLKMSKNAAKTRLKVWLQNRFRYSRDVARTSWWRSVKFADRSK